MGSHPQRLPPNRIQRAHIADQIGFDEDPALPGLRAGDEATPGPHAHLFGMHVQKRCGFREREGAHGGRVMQGCPARHRHCPAANNSAVRLAS